MKRLLQTIVALIASSIAAAAPSATIDWPTKTVKIIAPFPAGGTVDIVARTVGQKLADELHQSFIVDNRGGAGGSLGTAVMAHAAPDGYTIMVNHMGLAFNATLYDNLSYDTLRDVLPVAYVGATPNVLVVTKSFPAKSVGEFLALARAKPGTINYGSGGVGSAGHLPMELLQAATGIKLVHVPYKGAAGALTDTIAGQIQMTFGSLPSVAAHIRSDKVRALAVTGAKRSPAFPNVPTLGEGGLAGFELSPWFGLLAPAGTPEPVVKKINADVAAVLGDKDLLEKFAANGADPYATTPEQFSHILQEDIHKWAQVVKASGAKID
jgi:tripartite-type tricarboxylate transporter receptor subunit TctC